MLITGTKTKQTWGADEGQTALIKKNMVVPV